MPEFEKQYNHYVSVFGQDAMKLMNFPQPGQGMEEAVFVFGKSAGQMIRKGNFKQGKGEVNDFEFQLSDNLTFKGDADVSAYSGQTSAVIFELIQEPGPTTILHIKNHDMRLDDSLSHLAIPDGYIAKDGGGMILAMKYFMKYPGPCEDAMEFKGCDTEIEWFDSKMYLTRLR